MVEIVGSIPFLHHTQSPCIVYGMVRWGSPKTPSHKQMIMKYIIEFLSFAVLTLLCLYSFTVLMVMI